MDIGRTNKRITFCRYTEKQNELLQTETALEEIKTVWASVEPTRGSRKSVHQVLTFPDPYIPVAVKTSDYEEFKNQLRLMRHLV